MKRNSSGDRFHHFRNWRTFLTAVSKVTNNRVNVREKKKSDRSGEFDGFFNYDYPIFSSEKICVL